MKVEQITVKELRRRYHNQMKIIMLQDLVIYLQTQCFILDTNHYKKVKDARLQRTNSLSIT